MASSDVVRDPGDEGGQSLRVARRVERPQGCDLARLLVLDADCNAQRSQALLRTFDVCGHTLLDGTSKFEQIDVSRCPRGSRVHPGSLALQT
jgi:hypothetical protein